MNVAARIIIFMLVTLAPLIGGTPTTLAARLRAKSRKNMWGEGTRYEFLPGPHVFFALQQRLPGAEGPPEGKERRPLPASPTHSYAPWRSGLS